MPYPRQPRQENPNPEAQGAQPVAPGAAPVLAPQAPKASGGAPVINRFWGGSPPPKSTTPAAPTFKLRQIQEQFGPLSEDLKARIKAKYDSLPESDRGSAWWQTFQSYPNEMANMIVRRAWTNQLQASGPVSEWMGWLQQNRS
jgi:hypothetical protein